MGISLRHGHYILRYRQEVADEEAEVFVELALGLRRDGLKDDRRFPGAGAAGEDGSLCLLLLIGYCQLKDNFADPPPQVEDCGLLTATNGGHFYRFST